jgi:hypothetical protein
MGEGPPCRLPAGRFGEGRSYACPGTRLPAEGGGVQLPAPGPQAQVNALTHGLRGSRLRVMVVSSVICPLLRQTKNSRPHSGRESQRAHAVPPDLMPVLRLRSGCVHHLCGCNGPSRLPYCAGNHTGLPLRFGVTLAGGFHRRLPEQALNHWPCSLCRRTDRLLVPVFAFGYKLSYYMPEYRAVKQRFDGYVIIGSSKKPVLSYQNVPKKCGGIGLK